LFPFRVHDVARSAMLNATKDELKNMPEFKYSE
jgi:hypothetical protein